MGLSENSKNLLKEIYLSRKKLYRTVHRNFPENTLSVYPENPYLPQRYFSHKRQVPSIIASCSFGAIRS